MRAKLFRQCFLISALISTTALAANTFMCPKTYTYVSIGDTPQTVMARCGAPQSTSIQTARVRELKSEATEWVYPASGMTILINNGQIIAVNNSPRASIPGVTACAAANMIRVGMSEAKLAYLCGMPQKMNQKTYQYHNVKESVWTYQTNPSIPSTQLTFRNGKLFSIN